MSCKGCDGIIVGSTYTFGGTSPLCFRCFEELEALAEHRQATENVRRAKAAKRDLTLLGWLFRMFR